LDRVITQLSLFLFKVVTYSLFTLRL